MRLQEAWAVEAAAHLQACSARGRALGASITALQAHVRVLSHLQVGAYVLTHYPKFNPWACGGSLSAVV